MAPSSATMRGAPWRMLARLASLPGRSAQQEQLASFITDGATPACRHPAAASLARPCQSRFMASNEAAGRASAVHQYALRLARVSGQ